MNDKSFDDWNEEKKLLNALDDKRNFYINPREIWYVKMGKNVGFEENGKTDFLRPVLVLKKVGILFFVVAMTSKGKDKNVFYHRILKVSLHNKKYQESSFVILSQVKVMDKKRFLEMAGSIPKEEFIEIQKKLRAILF